jgi:hypothetical protein
MIVTRLLQRWWTVLVVVVVVVVVVVEVEAVGMPGGSTTPSPS